MQEKPRKKVTKYIDLIKRKEQILIDLENCQEFSKYSMNEELNNLQDQIDFMKNKRKNKI